MEIAVNANEVMLQSVFTVMANNTISILYKINSIHKLVDYVTVTNTFTQIVHIIQLLTHIQPYCNMTRYCHINNAIVEFMVTNGSRNLHKLLSNGYYHMHMFKKFCLLQ